MNEKGNTTLESLVAMTREGHDYFRYAQNKTRDEEVRSAFGIAADIRSMMLEDLHEIRAIPDPGIEQPMPVQDPDASYRALRAKFDPRHPEQQAGELRLRETKLLGLVESVFRHHPSAAVHVVMKSYFPRLRQDEETMRRLWLRSLAA